MKTFLKRFEKISDTLLEPFIRSPGTFYSFNFAPSLSKDYHNPRETGPQTANLAPGTFYSFTRSRPPGAELDAGARSGASDRRLTRTSSLQSLRNFSKGETVSSCALYDRNASPSPWAAVLQPNSRHKINFSLLTPRSAIRQAYLGFVCFR